jgi:hypothetical protein
MEPVAAPTMTKSPASLDRHLFMTLFTRIAHNGEMNVALNGAAIQICCCTRQQKPDQTKLTSARHAISECLSAM